MFNNPEFTYTFIITCWTEGCFNSGIGIECSTTTSEIQACCGVCGKEITDIEQTSPQTVQLEEGNE
jgi:hypothetical protein